MRKTETTSTTADLGKSILSTGWPALDAHLDRLDVEAKAAVWAAL